MSSAYEGATPGFLVWRLSMKWRVAVDRAVAPLGLTHAQYSVVATLHGMRRSGERPSQRRLADHTGLEPLYVSKLARALEAAGLLERTRTPVTRAPCNWRSPSGASRSPDGRSRSSRNSCASCWNRSAVSTARAPGRSCTI
ncbi:hypothetical protein SGRIM128S_08933 [Streptomyces griseomycini]